MPRTATMPPAARGHQTLSAYISARFDEFSRSQKDVAQYVVDHLDEVAFHTAEELARRANTSSSTVVRFSQALGFEGFPELQEAAREEYRNSLRRTEGLGTSEPLFSIDQSPFEEALSRLGRIDAQTLVIGLSAGRPHPLVVRAMKIARHRKAPPLAVVDATLSDVSKLAERTLYYSSNSPAFVRSHTGLLSIIQALAYGVYARDAANYDDRIRAFKLK